MRFMTIFFLRNAFRSKRVFWMAILGIVPVFIAFILLIIPPLTGKTTDATQFFREIGFSLHLHILLPLFSALVGAGIIADEVEDGTLPYLLTRPVPKWRLVVSKVIAACMVVGMMLIVSLLVTYTVLSVSGGPAAWLSDMRTFLVTAIVLFLGVLVYVPLFGALGASIRKPVLVGLLFAFGWENFMAYMPTRIRLLTVVTYLHNLFPRSSRTVAEDGVSEIFKYLDSSVRLSAPVSVTVLVAMFIVFTGLTVSLLYLKEYRMEQG
jgi:ABC-2 type transport system permease protein